MQNSFQHELSNQTKESPDINDRYFEARNYLVRQQAVIFALLNHKYSFVISKPTKKSLITDQLFKIKAISSEDDTQVDVIELIENKCQEKLKFDMAHGINEKTAYRRYNSNKIIENHHFIIDLAREEGFFFNFKLSSGKNKSTKMETVTNIFFSGEHFLSQNEIVQMGISLGDCIKKKLAQGKEVKIEKNDSELHLVLEEFYQSQC
ncbi:TATA-binding protein-associated phosphoprotein [Entamoeba marina]